MKLLAHIEEIDKKKFGKPSKNFEQGANSIVDVYKSKKGIPETKFDKQMPLEEHLSSLVSELHARVVIERANKAYRMYGSKVDLLPVPAEADWHIGHSDRYGATIHFVTSGFNKGASANVMEFQKKLPRSSNFHSDKKHRVIQAKASFLNSLIGNGDFHSGNLILNQASQKHYAIDFGLAFTSPTNEIYSYDSDPKSKRHRWENYLNFWQMFLEHNIQYFDKWLTEESDKIIRKGKKEISKLDEADQDQFVDIVHEVTNDNIKTLKDNAKEIQKIVKDQLDDVRRDNKKKSNLKTVLEDLEKFERVGDSPEQGSNSIVVIHKSKSDSIKETKYEKQLDFEGQLDDLINEVMSFEVIKHVNKAFRMYGYKSDLLPIPHDYSWHLTYTRYGVKASFVTSGFNNAETAYSRQGKGFRVYSVVAQKASFLNGLIGNSDFHDGNYILKKASSKGYAIDFGNAFSHPFSDIYDYQEKEEKSKAYRWQKYLIFWESYIQNNRNNIVSLLKDEIKKMKSKLEKEMFRIKMPNTKQFKEQMQITFNENIYRLTRNMDRLESTVKEELKISRKENENVKSKK